MILYHTVSRYTSSLWHYLISLLIGFYIPHIDHSSPTFYRPRYPALAPYALLGNTIYTLYQLSINLGRFQVYVSTQRT